MALLTLPSESQVFQNKFNELMSKKAVTSKKELTQQAGKFFAFCVKRVKNGVNCPFPYVLVQNFQNK